jgi:DNA (cytosine-5)-methyltransferase 1
VTLTVGSLFSGIGGIDLGLERAGMRVVWQSEVDPYCCRVLAKHWPDVPNLGDVKLIDWEQVERVDLICGGYPCQPFSVAGRQRGDEDSRHLWPWMLDAIRVLRPRYALLENVPGHLALGFGRVLGDLAEVGYDATWDCIPAAAVGAPHLRDRVFVVAYPDGEGEPGVTFDAVPRPRVMVPDTDSDELRQQPVPVGWGGGAPLVGVDGTLGSVADAAGQRPPHGHAGEVQGQPVARWPQEQPQRRCWWAVEPDVRVRPDGVPAGLDGGRLDADATEAGPREALRPLRGGPDQEDVQRSVGGPDGVPASAVLRPLLHGGVLCQRCALRLGVVEARDEVPWDLLRVVWGYDSAAQPPHRREQAERLRVEHPDLVRDLSHHAPPPCSTCWTHDSWESGVARVSSGVPHRVDRLRALGNAVVPQVAELVGRAILRVVNHHAPRHEAGGRGSTVEHTRHAQ